MQAIQQQISGRGVGIYANERTPCGDYDGYARDDGGHYRGYDRDGRGYNRGSDRGYDHGGRGYDRDDRGFDPDDGRFGSNRRFDYDYEYERDQERGERGRLRRDEDSDSRGNGKRKAAPNNRHNEVVESPPKRRNSHASVLVDVVAAAVQDSQKSDITVVD